MTHDLPRRRFLRRSFTAVAGGTVAGGWMPRLGADDVAVKADMVRFAPEIEPLVRLLEETPHERVVDKVLGQIDAGRSYQQLLAALFLAGIRNVQPRPAVGFKFHCVMVVHSAHQAALAADDEHRWMPLLWGVDYFKRAQASDVREGDWTMAPPPTDNLPEPPKAFKTLDAALTAWDVEAADAAAAVVAQTASAGQILTHLARFAARDFRNIGHKSIYLANAFRTLDVIGWQHAQPVVRSLCYAILNHTGDPNPAESDLAVDRAGRENWERVDKIPASWLAGRREPDASATLLKTLRAATPDEASTAVVNALRSGVHPDSLYDGILLAASELVSRQSAIVPLHAVTTSNAMRYLYRTVGDDRTRRWLLLQNAAFLAYFRAAAEGRGHLADKDLLTWEPKSQAVDLEELFSQIGRDHDAAASSVLTVAETTEGARKLIGKARQMVFLKGDDSHDYKFSSAALEDYTTMARPWRARYLAGCSHLLHGSHEPTTPLAKKVLPGT